MAAARRRSSGRCSDETPQRHGEISLAGDVAYVPQTERSRLDFPADALDVVLMGTYGRLPWYRRVGRRRAGAGRGGARARRPRGGGRHAVRGALRRAAPAGADRPVPRAGGAHPAARRAADRRRPALERADPVAASATSATRDTRSWSPPTTSTRPATSTSCSASTAPRWAFGAPDGGAHPAGARADLRQRADHPPRRRAGGRRPAPLPLMLDPLTDPFSLGTQPAGAGRGRRPRGRLRPARASGSSSTARATPPSRSPTRCCPGW